MCGLQFSLLLQGMTMPQTCLQNHFSPCQGHWKIWRGSQVELLMARVNVKNEAYLSRFRVALHQYCCPLVSNFHDPMQGFRARWNKIPILADDDILLLVDGASAVVPPNPSRQDDSMYTVFKTASVQNVKVAEEKLAPLVPPSKMQEVKKGKGKATQQRPHTHTVLHHPKSHQARSLKDQDMFQPWRLGCIHQC